MPPTPKTSKKLDAKKAARLRRQQLDQEKRRLAKRERVRTWALAGVAVVAGGGIIVAVVLAQALKPTPIAQRALTSFGVSLAKAGCDPVKNPTPDKDVVIGPGSKSPKQTKGTYTNFPPVGGPHYQSPVDTTQGFYSVAQHPKVEQLVANELQLDTVEWYVPTLPSSQVKTLQQLAQRMEVSNPSFVVAPWDTSYGQFPAGKPIALATKGHVQYCTKVSGAATQKFTEQFPAVLPAPSSTAPASPAPTSPASGSPRPKATKTLKASSSPTKH